MSFDVRQDPFKTDQNRQLQAVPKPTSKEINKNDDVKRQECSQQQNRIKINESEGNQSQNEVEIKQEMMNGQANVEKTRSRIYLQSSKQRKTRTLITKQKLLQMNKIFNNYMNRQLAPDEYWNLKAIAKHLQLGYSTILHKYRQFRAHKKVKAGALITSMQKKRKYKKTLQVEKLIMQVMNQKQFFTASEMKNYIQNKYGMKFSRSIISRHLGDMGYSYKNVSVKNSLSSKIMKTRKAFVQIIKPLLERDQTLIYIDEMICSFTEKNEQTGVSSEKVTSILIACTIFGVLYFHIQDGFITRLRFCEILKQFIKNLRESALCKTIQGTKNELYLVMDMNSIHRDNSNSYSGLAAMLIEENAQIYYIPPRTPEFNPLEGIFQKIRQQMSANEREQLIKNYNEFWEHLQLIMSQIQKEKTEEYFLQMCQEMERYLQPQQ